MCEGEAGNIGFSSTILARCSKLLRVADQITAQLSDPLAIQFKEENS